MGLVGESTPLGHLSHRESLRSQQFDGPCQAALQYERMRRHADRVAKSAGEMRAADSRDSAELDQLKVAGQVRFDVVDHAAGLYRDERLGETASDRSRDVPKNDPIQH